jgi:hypothetical protein
VSGPEIGSKSPWDTLRKAPEATLYAPGEPHVAILALDRA